MLESGNILEAGDRTPGAASLNAAPTAGAEYIKKEGRVGGNEQPVESRGCGRDSFARRRRPSVRHQNPANNFPPFDLFVFPTAAPSQLRGRRQNMAAASAAARAGSEADVARTTGPERRPSPPPHPPERAQPGRASPRDPGVELSGVRPVRLALPNACGDAKRGKPGRIRGDSGSGRLALQFRCAAPTNGRPRPAECCL